MRALQELNIRTLDTKVLLASLSALAVLCSYRFYSYWTTGFFTSDEYGYYYDAVHGAIYSDRWFVGSLNIYLFKALGITNVDAFSYLLPFYLFFWTAVTFIVFYKLLKLLEFDGRTTALSLLSCFVLISFVLLSLGFLTEPVGLCLAMCGIYFLARYMKSRSVRGILVFPVLSAAFFGFAAGTREPYNALLVGGIAIIILIALGVRSEGAVIGGRSRSLLLAISVLVFSVAALFFLTVPTHAYSQEVAPISSQMLQTVASRTSAPTPVPFYREYIATNTLLIFLGGILLGWGPICIGIGLAGFVIVLRKSVQGGDLTARFMLLTSVVALGSYFVVSFINAPNPWYFSFQNYSTVIRFSDTALPAYFMAAPFFLTLISKNRKRIAGLAAVFVIFLIVAVPVYESYAASNLSSLGGQNPFAFGYQTPGAAVRDYFAAQPNRGPVYLAGLPFGWVFTPGVQDLSWVHAYTLVDNGQAPFLNYTNLVSYHWDSLYIYSSTPTSPGSDLPSFLEVPLLSPANSTYPYSISSSQLVASDSDFALLRVTLVWH